MQEHHCLLISSSKSTISEIEERSVAKMNNGYASPSSSPPTPPISPLPISVGPGCQQYYFSSSPSPSPTPPFTQPSSRHTSSESLPLLTQRLSTIPPPRPPSAFSLDLQLQDPSRPHNTSSCSSCLKDLLEWLVLRCCRHCSLPI